jgi:hypothetical protein
MADTQTPTATPIETVISIPTNIPAQTESKKPTLCRLVKYCSECRAVVREHPCFFGIITFFALLVIGLSLGLEFGVNGLAIACGVVICVCFALCFGFLLARR